MAVIFRRLTPFFPKETAFHNLRIVLETYGTEVGHIDSQSIGKKINVFYNSYEPVCISLYKRIMECDVEIPHPILLSNTFVTDKFKNLCAVDGITCKYANLFIANYVMTGYEANKFDENIQTKNWSFVCLNRRIKFHRILAVIFLKTYLPHYDNCISWQGPNFGKKHINDHKSPDYDSYNKWFSKEKISTINQLNMSNLTKHERMVAHRLFINGFFDNQTIIDNEDKDLDLSLDENHVLFHRPGKDRLFNVVCESFTNLEYEKITGPFMTEKTMKAILDNQVFIIIGQRHMLREMKKFGFKTFHPFIDESYDEEPNEVDRTRNAILQLYKLMHYDENQRKQFLEFVEPIRKHNLETMKKYTLDNIFNDIVRL